MAEKIKVGVVQATPILFDVEKSVSLTIQWIEYAQREGCELLLFPESFIPAYPRGISYDAVVGKRTERGRELWLDYWKNSIEDSSKYVKQIGDAAKKARMYVALGVTERERIGGTLYCSLFYFGSDGSFLGKHRKLKPTGLERFLWGDGDGTTLTTYDTKLGRIGGLICWENYMPLARMSMYNKGVEIYLAPTADARSSWQSTMQHIALEGRCFVLASNQYVRKSDYPERYQEFLTDEPEIMSAGGSVIITPSGEILNGPLINKEGLLMAELDFDLLAKMKLDFDVVGHYSRNDVFSFGVNGQPETKHFKGL
ncbi:carbon-nitrogen hydrolase family protein [Sphingobacterium chuzhouense]|uniref:Carbon-nitrogen hydrolase family protein n=1 Tax=Sphingobacterium chuzhouense TaxID=1742264 RepID=A0ABR7XT17_9SPHI|nr:carbon-nitrogen hydrolase family protein [Sphingobacterium chuzhouense]MBD1422311.1 carbon-nitrogen hydrolase family protein [Sphingobacterium chuzhouense]